MRTDENGVRHFETVEDVMEILGVDRVTAREILDIQSGASDGDVVDVAEGGQDGEAPDHPPV